ncbi:MAG: hypothetical protein ACOC3T_00965 [Bacteroidota bacterium]
MLFKFCDRYFPAGLQLLTAHCQQPIEIVTYREILVCFGKTYPVRYCGKIYEAIFKDKEFRRQVSEI